MKDCKLLCLQCRTAWAPQAGGWQFLSMLPVLQAARQLHERSATRYVRHAHSNSYTSAPPLGIASCDFLLGALFSMLYESKQSKQPGFYFQTDLKVAW